MVRGACILVRRGALRARRSTATRSGAPRAERGRRGAGAAPCPEPCVAAGPARLLGLVLRDSIHRDAFVFCRFICGVLAGLDLPFASSDFAVELASRSLLDVPRRLTLSADTTEEHIADASVGGGTEQMKEREVVEDSPMPSAASRRCGCTTAT